MKKPDLEIYKNMPNDTRLNTPEIFAAFGYTGRSSTSMIRDGFIPESQEGRKKGQVRFWVLGDLRIAEYQKVEKMNIPNLDNYKYMHDRANFGLKDISIIFGYEHSKSNNVLKKIERGTIPKPDSFLHKVGGKPRPFWKLGELRKLKAKMLSGE